MNLKLLNVWLICCPEGEGLYNYYYWPKIIITNFVSVFESRLLYDFYTVNHISIDNYIRCFDEYFKKLLPLLYNHFQEENVSSRMFLMDWIITLFTKVNDFFPTTIFVNKFSLLYFVVFQFFRLYHWK